MLSLLCYLIEINQNQLMSQKNMNIMKRISNGFFNLFKKAIQNRHIIITVVSVVTFCSLAIPRSCRNDNQLSRISPIVSPIVNVVSEPRISRRSRYFQNFDNFTTLPLINTVGVGYSYAETPNPSNNFESHYQKLEPLDNNKVKVVQENGMNFQAPQQITLKNKKENYNFLIALGGNLETKHKNNLVDYNSLTWEDRNELNTNVTRVLLTQTESFMHGVLEMSTNLIEIYDSHVNDLYRQLRPVVSTKYQRFVLTKMEDISPGERANYCGLTAITHNNRPVNLKRSHFHSFCRKAGIVGDEYRKKERLIQNFQTVMYHFNILEQYQFDLINALNLLRATYQGLTELNFFSSTREVLLTNAPPTIIDDFSLQASPVNLQLYSRPLPRVGLNLAASCNLKNREYSFGIGKAFHTPIGSKNFGLVTGVDIGISYSYRRANSSFSDNRFLYRGISAKLFVGVGISV